MKRPKYGNRRVVVDGISFASVREARRYSVLKLMAMVGDISDLELQPKFPIMITPLDGGEPVKVGRYTADFMYRKGDQVIIEDAKGYATDIYKLRKKIIEAMYGITITEV